MKLVSLLLLCAPSPALSWTCNDKAMISLPYVSCPSETDVDEVDCDGGVISDCCTIRAYFTSDYSTSYGGGSWYDYSEGATMGPTATCYLGTDRDVPRRAQEWLRVESAGFPNHPYSGPNAPVDQSYDFLAPVYPTLDDGLGEQDLCDTATLSTNTPPKMFFWNGVPGFGLSAEDVDPINPPSDEYTTESVCVILKRGVVL